MRRSLLLLTILPLAAGCVSAPARRAPETEVVLPGRWSAGPSASGEIGGAWWESFGDPSLDRVIELALENNQVLRVAAARLDRAAADARIAGADLKPSIAAGFNASRRRQNFIGLPLPGGGVLTSTSTSLGVSIDTSWEVDLWGRIRAGARAAVAEYQAAEADMRGARLSIAAQAAKTWFAVLEAQQQVELARSSADSFRSVAEQIRLRYEQGLRPALELRLALSNQATAEALYESRRIQLDATLRQLEVLLGRYPSAALLDELAASVLPDRPGEIPAGLPAELVSRRPDLVAAERRLAAVDQRVLQARRALYPRMSLTAGGGTASDALSDLLDGDFRVWSIVANLAQPLFQGGRLRAGVDRAEAASEEALAGYVNLALLAFAEVETTLAAESYLAAQERSLSEATEHLVAARELAEKRYRWGLSEYLVVLESQSRALTAQSNLLALRRELLTNRIDLHLALGGDFDADIETSASDQATASEQREDRAL